jgi:hypothetical protein
VASVAAHRSCSECAGTGWIPYRSETLEGEFEEAYRLCPNCYSPRYCTGAGAGRSCPRPGTTRHGLGYYCSEHIVVVHDGGYVGDAATVA